MFGLSVRCDIAGPLSAVSQHNRCVAAAKQELAQRQLVSRAECILNATTDALREDFFVRPDVAFLREAYVGTRLARHLNAPSIQIPDDTFPDFRIFFSSSHEDFECTEVMDSCRKRGDEYKTIKERRVIGEKNQPRPIPDRLFSRENCIHAIREGCKKKIRRYGERRRLESLVIYLNDYWPSDDELSTVITSGTCEARLYFNTVYVLTGSQVFNAEECI